MKSFYYSALAALFFLSSCVKENTPVAPSNDVVDTSAQVKFTGNFKNGPYGSVKGTAKIIREFSGKLSLVLDSVTISNGPDLHVYISKEEEPLNFIDLGKLKSVSGTQIYTVNATPDFTEYKYALVHCQRFNHLFGSAELMMK